MSDQEMVRTEVGTVLLNGDGLATVITKEGPSKRSSLGAALVELSVLTEEALLSDYSVEYLAETGNLLVEVQRTGAVELFPNSPDGWFIAAGSWLPAPLRNGAAENVAPLVGEFGDMGVRVELFVYETSYLIQWMVVDFDDQGVDVFGAVSVEEAERLAQEKADDLGREHGLQRPAFLGLANLPEEGRHQLPEVVTHCAVGTSAWMYDSAERVSIDLYLAVSGPDDVWLVTEAGSTRVVGRFDSWPDLKASLSTSDGWDEVWFDWLTDEPDDLETGPDDRSG